MNNLFGNIDLLGKGLDASWLRNEVIANNIANVDTAGFKSSKVDFESSFKDALKSGSFCAKTTRDKHIKFNDTDNIEANIVKDTATTYGMDGNNVNIDYESTELAKNTIFYNTLISQVKSEFRKLRMVISEGR